MYSIILAIVVLIGLYFIYNQISNLNELLEQIVEILRSNKGVIKNNSDTIINQIDNVHTQSNKSIFDPETIISKLMGDKNILKYKKGIILRTNFLWSDYQDSPASWLKSKSECREKFILFNELKICPTRF